MEGRLIDEILREKYTLAVDEKKYLLDRYDNGIKRIDCGIGEF